MTRIIAFVLSSIYLLCSFFGGASGYSLGFQVNTSARAQQEDAAVIIDSKQALDEFHARYGDLNNALGWRFARYGNAWFKKNSLIIVTRAEPSISSRIAVEGLALEDGTATVSVARWVPGIGLTAMGYWVIALEVPKGELAGITQARAVYVDKEMIA